MPPSSPSLNIPSERPKNVSNKSKGSTWSIHKASTVSNELEKEKKGHVILLYKYIIISKESPVILRLQKVKDMNMHTPLEHHLILHFLLGDLTHQNDHIKIFSRHLTGPIGKTCHHKNKKGQMKVYYICSYCPWSSIYEFH